MIEQDTKGQVVSISLFLASVSVGPNLPSTLRSPSDDVTNTNITTTQRFELITRRL